MKMNENSKVTLTFGQLKRLVKESQDSQMTEDVAKYIADIVQKGLDKAYPGVKLIAYGDDYPHGIDMSNMNISNGKLDKEDERWLGINVKFPNIDDFPGSWTPNGLDIAVKVGSRPDDCDLMFGGWEPNDPKDTKGYYQDTVHRLQAAGYDMDNLTNNLKSIAGKAMDDAAEYVEDCYGEDAEYDYDPDAHYWPRRPAELAGVPSTPYPQRITLWEKKKSPIRPRTTDKWSIVNKAGKYLSYDYSFGSHGFDSNIRKLLRFKSKEGAEKYIVDNRLSDFCKERGAKIVPAPFVVRFSASGFPGGKPQLYPDWESLMNDVQSVADDHNGNVKDWGDLVVTADGQEIARWEIR